MNDDEIGFWSFVIWRSSNAPPISWDIGIDHTGSIWRLFVTLPGGQTLTLSTDDPDSGLTLTPNADGGLLSWAYTPEQSRLFPLDQPCPYELWRFVPAPYGEERPYFFGAFTGRGGRHAD